MIDENFILQSKIENQKSISLLVVLCLQVARHTIQNDRPDKAYCYGTTKAPDLLICKKPPKYTPFSWTSWLFNERV